MRKVWWTVGLAIIAVSGCANDGGITQPTFDNTQAILSPIQMSAAAYGNQWTCSIEYGTSSDVKIHKIHVNTAAHSSAREVVRVPLIAASKTKKVGEMICTGTGTIEDAVILRQALEAPKGKKYSSNLHAVAPNSGAVSASGMTRYERGYFALESTSSDSDGQCYTDADGYVVCDPIYATSCSYPWSEAVGSECVCTYGGSYPYCNSYAGGDYGGGGSTGGTGGSDGGTGGSGGPSYQETGDPTADNQLTPTPPNCNGPNPWAGTNKADYFTAWCAGASPDTNQWAAINSAIARIDSHGGVCSQLASTLRSVTLRVIPEGYKFGGFAPNGGDYMGVTAGWISWGQTRTPSGLNLDAILAHEADHINGKDHLVVNGVEDPDRTPNTVACSS